MSEQENAPFRAAPVEPGTKKRPPWGVMVAIACALVVAAIGWRKVLGHRSWYSTARRVTWVGPDGRRLGTKVGDYDCMGDVRFDSMIDGERVWTFCGSGGGDPFPNGALAIIDPARAEARVVAPFDRKVQWLTGLLPGPTARSGSS